MSRNIVYNDEQLKLTAIKDFYKRFLIVFSIEIYSEPRNENSTLYKHFVTIYLFNKKVFHTFWKTGTYPSGKIHINEFYERKR
jgi:hypothetical protein